METISIKNLSFSYPLKEKLALNNINLEINEGEFITICGKSGCGKSTLLKLLKPIIKPYGSLEGSIFFCEKDINELDDRQQASRIGYVFQNPDNQIVTDKVYHELAFGLESLGEKNEVIRLRVGEMAAYFGIENWFYKNVNELSGGQKQMLNLASIMVMQPDLLLLDEPTSQLDPIAANDFLETIKKINRDFGTTVIIVEHNLEEVFPSSDKVVVMEEGKIICSGTPTEVGEKLKESKNDMFVAMPAPMQVYSLIEYKEKCPLTVKEGRNMLKEYLKGKEIKVDYLHKENIEYKESIITFKEVYFKYEKHGKDIVKDLSFQVKRGEIYSILGGNGTGKTTTLNLINRINKHYRGKILIEGKNIEKIPPEDLYYSNLATLPQDPQSLFIKKTVNEDLHEILKGRKLCKEEINKKIQKIVNFLEIEELLDRHPYDLSGGEQQKVALGKVLLLNPKILLLDEPTKGIDKYFKEKLGKYLTELSRDNLTIIIVSHDIEFCAKYSNRCSMFFNGSIISTNYSNEFFCGNSFYTTSANRMSRGIFKNSVISKDVATLCNLNK